MSGATHEDSSAQPVSSAPVRRMKQGPVMPIGGAEDKSADADDTILQRFVDIAGGKRARIAVVPTASEDPEKAGDRYVKVFARFGVTNVEVLLVAERAQANEQPAIELLERATGVFISGGDQARLVTLLVGTKTMECVRERNAEGVVVAGTSAGASILAAHMLVGGTGIGGNSSDSAARKGMIDLVAGFGLLQDVIVDQHFSQRGRMGRLLSVFAPNPGLVGIGLDEDTAVLIERTGMLEVLGSGMVTLIDGRNAVSDYFAREPGEVLSVVNSSLHVLGPGRRFNLDTRQPLPFDEAEEGRNTGARGGERR